ncbi:MAG: TIM barrel protein [Nanoarchaeota archaeon]|nr:TIM barrel protein [Nanoarchaeota archaeon]MBU1974544.1 TIM barrel protein [Nanoarchaeota archaeon]
MDKLRFGTAGIPISTPQQHNTINGIKHVRTLNLDCLELEFVHSVNISAQKAPEVKQTAKEHDIKLTCHGQYYINLNSQEKEKMEASKYRIYNAAKIASLCGAKSMTFHAAYYMKQAPELVYQKVKENLKPVLKKLQDEGHSILLRPETTGKATQWGDLKEIIKLSQELEQVLPCIDFSHLHARTQKNNTREEFQEMLTQVESKLGRVALNKMHIHLSGINYGEKGERNHLTLTESDMNYQDLLKVWKEFKIKGIVISESPNIEKDALLLQNYWKRI